MGLEDMAMCYNTSCPDLTETPENIECVNTHPMIEKPDWDVVCHASAWDMSSADKSDYRYVGPLY